MEPNTSTVSKKDGHFFWNLFKSTFLISAFTVGGGFIIIPLLKSKYVDQYHWIDDKNALDMVAIAQAMPGIVAANTAIILGYRMAGILGTIVALGATILPPLITLSIISYCYDYVVQNEWIRLFLRGMQCGATALIVNVAIDLLVKQVKKKLALPIVIIIITCIGEMVFDLNIMLLVLIDGLAGLLLMRKSVYN